MRRLLFALPLLIYAAACSAIPGAFLPPTDSSSPVASATIPPGPALPPQALRNALYPLPGFGDAIHACSLQEGACTVDDPVVGRIEVKLIEPFAFGDLNDDGAQDAAVLLAARAGGSGVFVSLHAVLNQNGQPQPAASSLIDDRPLVQRLTIDNGRIVLDATVHDHDDAACCPEWQVRRAFRLVGLSLMMVQAITYLPDGRERSVVIESPRPGEEIGDQIYLSGRVTIAPFENTLAYRVYNREGKELFAGPLMVDAPQPGTPGVFLALLNADRLPRGRLRLVVVDLSPVDASILALDSVEIMVR